MTFPIEDEASLRHDKQRLREEAKRARAAAFAKHGADAAHRLAAWGLGFAGIRQAAMVSGFVAIGDEINPLPLLERLLQTGHEVALPVIIGKGRPLLFRAWRPGDETRPGVWGIREPLDTAAVVEPDVLLVPLLAVDFDGYRLGYGGGFYDRTLARLRSMKAVIAIGLAFDEQRVEALPRGRDDEPLDWVLTPSGAVKCRGDF